MRIIFSIFKWLLLGLLSVVLLAAVLPQGAAFLDQRGKEKRADYLRDNAVYSGSFDGMGAMKFPAEFYANRLFLFGEMHGFASPQSADLGFIDHLNTKIGLRWYMAELGPETAMAFNHYLATGDDALARIAFDAWAKSGAQWGNKQFFAKLGKMRALNQTRPVERRVYFLGVDQIQNSALAEYFTNDNTAPAGDDQAMIAARINRELLFATTSREKANRYTNIVANINHIVADEDIKAEPLYGFWGLFHVLQTTVNGTSKPLAMVLKDHPAFSNGVTSMLATFGPGSYMMLPSEFMPGPLKAKNGETYVLLPGGNDNPYMGYLAGVHDLETAAAGAQISVYNMDANPSPYADGKRIVKFSGIMTKMQKFEIDGNASEAVDYIVYLPGSPALTPWVGDAYDIFGVVQKK